MHSTMWPPAQAEAWSSTCLRVLRTPYPYGAAHVTESASDVVVDPVSLHPAFHGALDWHSSCHMQWSLVTMLPHLPAALAGDVVSELDARLDPWKVRVEADYLRARPSYERPYGWAWALMLEAALHTCTHPAAVAWAAAVEPLADVVEGHVAGWASTHPLPVRHGVHSNSAFALSLVLHAADRTGRTLAAVAARDAALRWFAGDAADSRGAEPSGIDFLSPTLSEAELMARALPPDEARGWLARFLGDVTEGDPLLSAPPTVNDSDGHLAHLNGLALSRAWQWRALAPILDDRLARLALASAQVQYDGVEPLITSGDFMSTHWLVSFALLASGALAD